MSGSSIGFDVMRETVRVPMRDGTELATDIYRPARDGRPVDDVFPTVLERTPYDRRRRDLYLTAQYFASRGYAVVLQDGRGRYDSDGEFFFMLHTLEEQDGYDTIEWVAAQSWSDGRVGTTGLSYTGANQQAAAVARPPHLTTQIVMDAGLNYWLQCLRNHGAFGLGVSLPYAFYMASTSKAALASPAIRDELLRASALMDRWLRKVPLKRGQSPLALVPDYEDWYLELQSERTTYDRFWRDAMGSLASRIGDHADIPVLLMTSWYGHHAAGTFEKFVELTRLRGSDGAPVHLVSGVWLHAWEYTNWTHAGEVDFGLNAAFVLDDFRLRWFDRHLKGLDTRPAHPPKVRVFVMGGGSGRREPTGRLQHGGQWVNAQAWPPEFTAPVSYYLQPGGLLGPTAPPQDGGATSFSFDPADPVPTIGGHVQNPIGGTQGIIHGGAFDQRGRADLRFCNDTEPLSARADVLVFRTAPLLEPVETVGPLRASLWVRSTAPDTDFTVKLVDETPSNDDYPHGFAMNLADGIVRVRHRGRSHEPQFIEPGRIYEVTVEMPPTANRFAVGHRIRLDVSSSSFPQFDVNPNSGGDPTDPPLPRPAVNTVHHSADAPSQIVLHVVAGSTGPIGD